MTNTNPPRLNLYAAIHKGLRLGHAKLLTSLGATDWSCDTATNAALAALSHHLDLCQGHLDHEDSKIHPAVKTHSPDIEAALEDEHTHHAARLRALTDACTQLAKAPAAARPDMGHRLYLDFAAFMAADFAHMAQEETLVMPLLWRNLTDAEILDIHNSIVGDIAPDKMMAYMQLMLPAIDRHERHAMLKDMQENAPAEAFQAILDHAAQPTLHATDWDCLVNELGLAA